MAVHSKEAASSMKNMLTELLVGSRKKQLISSTILLIVLFLVHVKNKNGSGEEIKIKLHHRDKKKVQNYPNLGR